MQQLNKQLILDFDQVSSTLFELGNVFSDLYSTSLDYSNSVNNEKFSALSDIYVNLNNFMVSWGLFKFICFSQTQIVYTNKNKAIIFQA